MNPKTRLSDHPATRCLLRGLATGVLLCGAACDSGGTAPSPAMAEPNTAAGARAPAPPGRPVTQPRPASTSEGPAESVFAPPTRGNPDPLPSAAPIADMATDQPPDAPPMADPDPPGPVVHNCEGGESPDPRDAEITSEPAEWVAPNGDIDLVLPDEVLTWMDERVWVESHDAWHNIRRCAGGGGPRGFGGFGGFGGSGSSEICEQTDLLPSQNECENARDGYEFLAMHRHMIIALRQAFPRNQALFDGFPSFPYEATDVPQQWRDRWGSGWSASILETAEVLEDIENNLERFPSEGDLGMYIQCGGMASGISSIHGALHFKWVVNGSPHSLGNQAVNLENYMFWKLHGWIDDIWERYRVAKGLDSDPNDRLEEELSAQCWEMHDLGHVIDPEYGDDREARLGGPTGDDGTTGAPPAAEAGVFHETVRPILEETCAGCHSGSSPASNLPLGGSIDSADLVMGLVDGPTLSGGQFVLVSPGAPERSWLYLKASDMARDAGCEGRCNAQVMPPTGRVTLSDQELDAIYQWIADGAQ